MTDPGLSRERIVDVAERIVRSDGVEALGLRGLGRELGVTAPALYGYVENLEDLRRALAERQFGALMARFDEVAAQDPAERVRALSRAYIDYSLDEPNLFKVLFLYPPDVGGTGVEHELPMATKVFLAAAEPLERGIASGEFAATDAAAASLAVWAAVHGCATALSLDFGFDQTGVDRLVDDVLDMVIAGLRG
ncbi:TetR/AcrR family transcriptional regulator [Actinospongicola halichondriae]|uniref:TetR/AcrR family transcriptional regulator n=1 Tax=Actinospongicola halichondriae TaxID=3236844 RepID=UPI003D41E1B3